jgi:hypothetical protein
MLDQLADFLGSKRIAAEHNGRLATLKEFISALRSDPSLFAASSIYWLGDKPGLRIAGFCRIDYEKEALVQVPKREWSALPLHEKAYANWGQGHISIGIFGIDSQYRRRYGELVVSARSRPGDSARVAYVPLGDEASKSEHRHGKLKGLVRKFM